MAAIHAFQRALELRPDFRDAVLHLSKLLGDLGRQEAGIDLLRKAITQLPHDVGLHGNLLYALHHTAGDDGSLLLSEHRAWANRHAEPLQNEIRPHGNDRTPDRRLRVGYVSADFREHPASRFLLPLIEAHDRTHVEVFCYSDVRRPDSLTHRCKAASDQWRETTGCSDQALAELVRQDGIDILIDPTGHMAYNRLLTFARRPAPVQIAYFGYPGTVAMKAIEYRITDALLDPPGLTEHHYTEKLVRVIPSAMVWAPLTATPDVGPLPALSNGYITFGALNRLSKVNPLIIGLWAQALAAVPQSRLLLLSPTVSEVEAEQEVRQFFARNGVPSHRLELAPRSPRESYLKLFNLIDVHLDTFPYNGCTTTCDGLWMGVPTITLAGRAYASRIGVSLLSQVGLSDMIANALEEFVAIATRFASNLPRLAELRSCLRQRMKDSPLMDAKSLARGMEAAYRTAWNEWCSQTS